MTDIDLIQECVHQLSSSDDIKGIEKNILKIKNIFIDSIMNNSVDTLSDMFQIDERRIEAFENLYVLSDKNCQKVYYYAILKTFAELGTVIGEKERKIGWISQIQESKHLGNILSVLYDGGEITHKVLANALGISTNALTNIIKRYSFMKLWTKSKKSRYSIYTITYEGKSLYREYLKRNLSAENNSKEISRFLLVFLDSLIRNVSNPAVDSGQIISEVCDISADYRGVMSSKDLKYKIDVLMLEYKNQFSYVNDKIRIMPEFDGFSMDKEEKNIEPDIFCVKSFKQRKHRKKMLENEKSYVYSIDLLKDANLKQKANKLIQQIKA